MAIDNLSLSPIRVQAPAPGALPLAANNAPAPSIGQDQLKLSSTPVSLLANANTVAAANTASVKPAVASESTGSYTVKPGDTLSGIAQEKLGDATRWPEIYDANKAQIANPDLIYPGQTFTLPGAKPAAAPFDDTPVDTSPTDPSGDDEPTDDLPGDDAPTTADVTPAQAPPAPAIRKPIPRDFPPYGPTRCFPHHEPVSHSDRSELLRQKLELLKMEEQVVRLELQLDEMLKRLDAPTHRTPVLY